MKQVHYDFSGLYKYMAEAMRRVPIIRPGYEKLFAEKYEKFENTGRAHTHILRSGVPADFLLGEEYARLREDEDFDPDYPEEQFYRFAEYDFEELCGGVFSLKYREIHRKNIKSGTLKDRFPLVRWISAPFCECLIATQNDGKYFGRYPLLACPPKECTALFCGCSLRIAERNEVE